METVWFCPETPNGKPSQRQLARFVMLGKSTVLGEDDLKPIDDLAVNIRKLYKRLNPIAHLRAFETDLQDLTESLIDVCQICLLKILEMRERYYVG